MSSAHSHAHSGHDYEEWKQEEIQASLADLDAGESATRTSLLDLAGLQLEIEAEVAQRSTC